MSDERKRRATRAALIGGPEEIKAEHHEQVRHGAPCLREGRRYVMHVLPGTILRATVARAEGPWIELCDAQWLELTTEHGSPWQLATGAEDAAVIRRAWELADGTLVAIGTIAMASPCPGAKSSR